MTLIPFSKRQPAKGEKLCPYDDVAYERVPGYVSGYGCPVCKAISFYHLPVPDIRVRMHRDQLRSGDTLILAKRGGGERFVPGDKWWIDRNTPVGEDADLYERKPYGGKRYVSWKELIAVERIIP